MDEEKFNESDESNEEISDEREEASSTTLFQKSKERKITNVYSSELMKSKESFEREREKRRENTSAYKKHF